MEYGDFHSERGVSVRLKSYVRENGVFDRDLYRIFGRVFARGEKNIATVQ